MRLWPVYPLVFSPSPTARLNRRTRRWRQRLSSFQCAHGYQPPLFPALEKEFSCPSHQTFIRGCHHTWAQAWVSLLLVAQHYASSANRRCSQAPTYQVGQRMWLSTCDLPLQVESKKLAPRFIGPFAIERINPTTLRPLRCLLSDPFGRKVALKHTASTCCLLHSSVYVLRLREMQ